MGVYFLIILCLFRRTLPRPSFCYGAHGIFNAFIAALVALGEPVFCENFHGSSQPVGIYRFQRHLRFMTHLWIRVRRSDLKERWQGGLCRRSGFSESSGGLCSTLAQSGTLTAT
jgi:hypothetical protein